MANLWLVISLVVVAGGLIATVIPGLPGLFIVLAGQYLYAWMTDFQIIGQGFLLWQALLTIVGSVADIFASQAGARRRGASRAGIWGAVLGGLVGAVAFGPIGFIVGPLAGAIAGEVITGRPFEQATLIGWWAFLGMWVGVLSKLVIGVIMAGWFVIRVI